MGSARVRWAGGVFLACGMALTGRMALAETDVPVTEALHAYTTPEEKRDVADLILGDGVTSGRGDLHARQRGVFRCLLDFGHRRVGWPGGRTA